MKRVAAIPNANIAATMPSKCTQPQHLRPNDDPQHDFQNHSRDAKSHGKLHEQWSGDGHQQNQQNGRMSFGKHYWLSNACSSCFRHSTGACSFRGRGSQAGIISCDRVQKCCSRPKRHCIRYQNFERSKPGDGDTLTSAKSRRSSRSYRAPFGERYFLQGTTALSRQRFVHCSLVVWAAAKEVEARGFNAPYSMAERR